MSISYKNNELGGILNYYPLTKGLGQLLERGKVLYYSIVWIKEGSANLEVDFKQIVVKKDDVLFLTPSQYVSISDSEDINTCQVCFNREFYCVEMHDEEVSCNGLLFKGILDFPIIALDQNHLSKVQFIFASLEEESKVQDRIQEEMLKVLLKQLIIFCTRLAREQLNNSFNLAEDEADTIRHFSALVEKHFRKKHKVADYAEVLNKSPKTLSNLFKKYKASSPSEMIKERIILEAKRALIYTNLSNKEIAYDLGFDDPAHFSRYFSNATTLSPTKFKEVYFKPAQ